MGLAVVPRALTTLPTDEVRHPPSQEPFTRSLKAVRCQVVLNLLLPHGQIRRVREPFDLLVAVETHDVEFEAAARERQDFNVHVSAVTFEPPQHTICFGINGRPHQPA